MNPVPQNELSCVNKSFWLNTYNDNSTPLWLNEGTVLMYVPEWGPSIPSSRMLWILDYFSAGHQIYTFSATMEGDENLCDVIDLELRYGHWNQCYFQDSNTESNFLKAKIEN